MCHCVCATVLEFVSVFHFIIYSGKADLEMFVRKGKVYPHRIPGWERQSKATKRSSQSSQETEEGESEYDSAPVSVILWEGLNEAY